MNKAAAARHELKTYIDAIPESYLEIVRPMLSYLAESHENKPIIIETNLTTEEKADIRAGRKELKEHPENFIPWAIIKTEYANTKEKNMIEKRAASILGKKGGSATSEKKAITAAENGKKGGRPKNATDNTQNKRRKK